MVVSQINTFKHKRRERTRNEARAIILLRRRRYSINFLAKILGRSTSMIHRILKNNGMTGASIIGGPFDRKKVWHKDDMRKSGAQGLTIEIVFRSNKWTKLFQHWVKFIKGEEAEPP